MAAAAVLPRLAPPAVGLYLTCAVAVIVVTAMSTAFRFCMIRLVFGFLFGRVFRLFWRRRVRGGVTASIFEIYDLALF